MNKKIVSYRVNLSDDSIESKIAAFNRTYGQFIFRLDVILDFWARENLQYFIFDPDHIDTMLCFIRDEPQRLNEVLRQSAILDRRIGKVIENIHRQFNKLGFTDVKIAKVIFSSRVQEFSMRTDFHVDHDCRYGAPIKFPHLVPQDFDLQRDRAYCLYVDLMPFLEEKAGRSIGDTELDGIIGHEVGHALGLVDVPFGAEYYGVRTLLDNALKLQPYIRIPQNVRDFIGTIQEVINLGELIANWVMLKLYGPEAAKAFLAGVFQKAGYVNPSPFRTDSIGFERPHLEKNCRVDLVAFANKIGFDQDQIPPRLLALAKSDLFSYLVKCYEQLFDELSLKGPEEMAEGVIEPLALNNSDVFLSFSADQGIYAIGAAARARESIGLRVTRLADELPYVPGNVRLLDADSPVGIVSNVNKIASIGIVMNDENARGIVDQILSVVNPDGGLIHFKPRNSINDKDNWISCFEEVAGTMGLEIRVIDQNTKINGILFMVTKKST